MILSLALVIWLLGIGSTWALTKGVPVWANQRWRWPAIIGWPITYLITWLTGVVIASLYFISLTGIFDHEIDRSDSDRP